MGRIGIRQGSSLGFVRSSVFVLHHKTLNLLPTMLLLTF